MKITHSNNIIFFIDCVHLQVYRDSKARWGGAASKASLSLQQYLGCEAGFTLDKHSHTLALLCRDFTAVLAFETRERLIQWQVNIFPFIALCCMGDREN